MIIMISRSIPHIISTLVIINVIVINILIIILIVIVNVIVIAIVAVLTITWQKRSNASAVFSGVSLTGSATFST